MVALPGLTTFCANVRQEHFYRLPVRLRLFLRRHN